jgi:protocatechuate 3,4-dioxygenase beta subunit
MTRTFAAALVSLVVIAPPVWARTTAMLSGQVVADATGDPLPNVRVTVPSDALGAPVTLTDAAGRFSLPAPSGSFLVVASKSGYGRLALPLTTAAQPVTLRLRRGATISGRITDNFGEPVLGALVTAQVRSGQSQGFTISATTETDDRGDYRLPSLAEGSYIVGVMTMPDVPNMQPAPNGSVIVAPSMVRTYYPDATDPEQAQEFRVRPGDEQSLIDFVIPASRSANQPTSILRFLPPPIALVSPGADQARRPTGVIRGRVVSAEGGPLPYAQVALVSSLRPPDTRATHADVNGAFEFLDVPAGQIRLFASKPGYFVVEASQSSTSIPLTSAGVRVTIGDGETRIGVEITLARWATLTGHVFDEYGDPVEGAAVQLMQLRYEGGRRRLIPTDAPPHGTSDLGVYRLYGLAPGQYIVSAAVSDVRSADLPGYVRSYFPGTAIPGQAQFVAIGRSQDVSGIDIVLSRVKTFRVAGRILDAAGQPSMGGSVNLITSSRSTSVTNVSTGARLLPSGAFEFPNISPGQYVIKVDRGRRNGWIEGEFAAMAVTVGGQDVTGLIIRTSAGSSITGHISFDALDASTRPPTSAVELTPVPVDPDASPNNAATADIQADWTFRIAGVNGPRRLQLPQPPTGWVLKQILVNGVDITDRPLPFGASNQSLADVDVVLTDRVGELTGAVTDDDGNPVTGATVIVFADDHDGWYPTSRFLRKTVADESGRFSIAGLPSGTYYAAAAQPPSGGADAWQDPAFLNALIPQASNLTLADGQGQAIGLRIPRR